MLKGDDIKRFVKEAEDWQVEFKLAKGGVLDTFWLSVLERRGSANGGEWVFMI